MTKGTLFFYKLNISFGLCKIKYFAWVELWRTLLLLQSYKCISFFPKWRLALLVVEVDLFEVGRWRNTQTLFIKIPISGLNNFVFDVFKKNNLNRSINNSSLNKSYFRNSWERKKTTVTLFVGSIIVSKEMGSFAISWRLKRMEFEDNVWKRMIWCRKTMIKICSWLNLMDKNNFLIVGNNYLFPR